MLTLKDVVSLVDEFGYCILPIRELKEFAGIDIDSQDGLALFSETLEDWGICSLPRVVQSSKGYSVANLSKSLYGYDVVFSNPLVTLDKGREDIQSAMLLAKVTALIARMDGDVDRREIDNIKSSIDSLTGIADDEKYSIFIRTLSFLSARLYKDDLFQEFAALPDEQKSAFRHVALEVVIADQYIDKNEYFFLRELYRLSDIPPQQVREDIALMAKENNTTIYRLKNSAQREVITDVIEYQHLQQALKAMTNEDIADQQ